MKKIDNFSRAWYEMKKEAAKELHDVEDEGLGLTSLGIFPALQARADQSKQEKSADDPQMLMNLRDEGKAALRAAEERLKELKQAKDELEPQAAKLKSENAKLDAAIKSKVEKDMEEEAISDMVRRRNKIAGGSRSWRQ
jgi:predicted nuclease with TOPRIM domain